LLNTFNEHGAGVRRANGSGDEFWAVANVRDRTSVAALRAAAREQRGTCQGHQYDFHERLSSFANASKGHPTQRLGIGDALDIGAAGVAVPVAEPPRRLSRRNMRRDRAAKAIRIESPFMYGEA
jgi:hypothetical protein